MAQSLQVRCYIDTDKELADKKAAGVQELLDAARPPEAIQVHVSQRLDRAKAAQAKAQAALETRRLEVDKVMEALEKELVSPCAARGGQDHVPAAIRWR